MLSTLFDDFDAFAESVQGIDCSMMLQNPKNRRWSINVVNTDQIQVQLGRLGSGNIAEGQSHPDKYMFYMPLTDECSYAANGNVLEKNSFAILEPGCEFCVATRFEHDWCAVSVPSHVLAHSGDPTGDLQDVPHGTCHVTRASRQLVNRFRQSVHHVMNAAATCPQFESATAADLASSVLLKISSEILGRQTAHALPQNGRPRLPRQDIIHRAMALIECRDGQVLRVEDLTAAAGVSERTLRTAFNEYFGVGPIRYLQLRRLHQVRAALRTMDPDAISVTDVLVQHGEWEFSRFALRYRRLFGERPSQTLKTNKV